MSTRKSMTLPIIVSLIFIIIIISLFTNIEQKEVTCSKINNFENDVRLEENIIVQLDGKRIDSINVTKIIILPEKYRSEKHFEDIKTSLDRTLEYLGDSVKYTVSDDRIVVRIDVFKNEIILLDNIDFAVNNDIEIRVNSNTKSSDVITLTVGDSYTDGEFMQKMKAEGYSCK